ncbi:hypothetical protein [Brevundimonas albigilva]|uniref:hypothetical protein n=1 Tax=Brevundimonas albigilva TaxID=1312364 RepID=UPI003221A7A6
MNFPVQFQIVVFAVIAAIVLFQLYNVLGKRVGRQPQEDARANPRPGRRPNRPSCRRSTPPSWPRSPG